MATKAKKRNFIVNYFIPFGLKQICDILIVASAIVLIVGCFTSNLVITIGLGMYVVASILAIIRSIIDLKAEPNKRAPKHKAALANIIIMSVIFAVATAGFIYGFIV